MSVVSPAAFRQAMRLYPGAVTIITTVCDGTPYGLTASAVCSLSAEPPSVLCCINRNSRTIPRLLSSGVFCINVLAGDQAPLALRFAADDSGQRRARFEGAQWSALATGSPALQGARLSIDCRLERSVPVHSHDIVIGAVVALQASHDAASALVYEDRQFGTFAATCGSAAASPRS